MEWRRSPPKQKRVRCSMTPYFDRPTPEMKREKRRLANRRYKAKHRDSLLAKKREYAKREATRARLLFLDSNRNDTPKQPPSHPPPPLTLDAWAKKKDRTEHRQRQARECDNLAALTEAHV